VLLLFLILPIFGSGCERDSEHALETSEAITDLAIGRMRVSVWPEYDDPSVLVIYDGRFEEAKNYPIKTSFLVPKGSVISDACSLSYEGQHFCQLYKTVNKGPFDEVSLLLPYPNFYLSFHTPRIDVTKHERKFDYRIKTNHPVNDMEIDIQQPLRSSSFHVSPPEEATRLEEKDDSISVVKGFKHFVYALNGIAKGQETVFKFDYIKKDPKPSVDIKFTSMKGPKVFKSSPYETQKKVRTYVYAVFGIGTVILIVLIAWILKRRKKTGAGN
jgi:hypothetical protein